MEKYLDLGYQTRGFSVAKEHLTVVQLRGYVLRGACFLSLHSADKKNLRDKSVLQANKKLHVSSP